MSDPMASTLDVDVDALLTVCSSPLWARQVAAAAPFASLEDLLECAETVLAELPDAEIDAALAGHPRIGEKADDASSAREQAGVTTASDDVRAALAAGNREYEERFGHVYLVCASDLSAEDLLAILTDRLGNEPTTERGVMRNELAKINRLRLRRLLTGAGSST